MKLSDSFHCLTLPYLTCGHDEQAHHLTIVTIALDLIELPLGKLVWHGSQHMLMQNHLEK